MVRFGLLTGDAPKLSLKSKKRLLNELGQDAFKYPTDFIHYVQVNRVRILEKLKVVGDLVAGGVYNQPGNIYLNAEIFRGTILNPKSIAVALHHELFHHAQRVDLEQRPFEAIEENKEWINLNPDKENAYDYSYAEQSKKNPKLAGKYTPGFATFYARASVSEDKAEVACLLMRDIKRALKLSQTDSVLEGKINLMESFFDRYSKGRMGEQYWQDLANGEVGVDYWGKR